MKVFNTVKFTVLIFFHVDGSKPRQKLRKKISAEKVSLKETVAKYNQLAMNNVVNLSEVENGNFPWKAELQNGDGKQAILPMEMYALM